MKHSVYDYSYEMRQLRNKRISFFLTLVVSIILFLTLFLNLVLFPVWVRSESMDPDIPKNSAVFVAPLLRTPKRGDVVYLSRLDDEKLSVPKSVINRISEFFTFQQFYPFGYTQRITGKPSLRRVVGLPGDTIYMKDYVLYVKPADQSLFLTEFEMAESSYNVHIYSVPVEWDNMGAAGNMSEYTLGEEEYFVLADNRTESSDSRLWGCISPQRIKGKAVLEYFPFNKIRIF